VIQTGKWVLKQLGSARFDTGKRSFTTYTLTAQEVAYYTLLAEGNLLQVCGMVIFPLPHQRYFWLFRQNMNGSTKSLGINLGPFTTGPTLSQTLLLARQTQQVLQSRLHPQQLRLKGS